MFLHPTRKVPVVVIQGTHVMGEQGVDVAREYPQFWLVNATGK